MRSLNEVRKTLYSLARILGDINAILGGPRKMLRRFGNKVIGRKLIRRLWWK